MNHQEFCWWLCGALSATPTKSPPEAKGATLEVIRAHLNHALTKDRALERIIEAQAIANGEVPHWTSSEKSAEILRSEREEES